jgi:hypothetical protein
MKLARLLVLLEGLAYLFNAAPGAAQNLIPDPTFSSGLSAWTVVYVTDRLEWNTGAGADGAPGFARLHPVLSLYTSIARICLPVEAGTTYSWGGFFRQDRDATSRAMIRFLPDATCETLGDLSEAQTPPLNNSNATPGTWYLRQGPDVVAPPGAQSVDFEVISIASPAVVNLDFDNMYFGRQGTGPPTQPVSVPTLSGSALLILAAVLACAGVGRLALR